MPLPWPLIKLFYNTVIRLTVCYLCKMSICNVVVSHFGFEGSVRGSVFVLFSPSVCLNNILVSNENATPTKMAITFKRDKIWFLKLRFLVQ